MIECAKSCLRRLSVYFVRSLILTFLTIFMVLAPVNIIYFGIYVSLSFYLRIFLTLLVILFVLTVLLHSGDLFKPITNKNIKRVTREQVQKARKQKHTKHTKQKRKIAWFRLFESVSFLNIKKHRKELLLLCHLIM